MIAHLDGMHETADYRPNTNIRLYDNVESDNYPPHWHTPIEIIMPLENIYTAICCQNSFIAKPGEIIVICPGVLHTLIAPETGRRLILQADISMLKKIHELNSIFSSLYPVSLITSSAFSQGHHKLSKLFFDIKNEYFESTSFSEAAIYADLISMLSLMGNQNTNTPSTLYVSSKGQEHAKKLSQICEYIDSHCTEDLTLDQIANMANFSKFHFTRLFKEYTHVSFYKYLSQKRISYAETLLADPEISVTEVAIRSGFSTPSAFIRMFKLCKDCTPTEYRKIFRKI